MFIAQLNIAKAKFQLDSPQLADFMENLDPVNATAESSPGFIWRLKDDSGHAVSIQAFEDPQMIINLSVWQSVDALKNFMFKTHHVDFLKRKQEWFERLKAASHVLWWIPKEHRPSLEEAKERLFYLREFGDSPYAFSFKRQFSTEDLKSYRH
ncbi:DUF3291 domain-containing protein [Aliikangiella marina]|uniref:DUF3291 domain-containing protein n=1 Tax=Aliikangiella marina TaxID=1712262 RepID=A0A545TCS2_9GAMM|nr:DUF3291 domain-containing protein [Aliikangiella marina]TQV75009.1 DUF3291 domain-containing protein [Aliikangiella marina]